MFQLTRDPIVGSLLPEDRRAGARVVFEGTVRDLNEGHRVLELEYEAFDELAIREGAAILDAARERFPILEIACTHRVGRLGPTDVAIRVEASAQHRREAFAACEFVVDEIKRRVPIWKKEEYAEGGSEWLNTQGAQLISPETYYARQIRMPEVGVAGQERLMGASVLVVGAGGLGCPALMYLGGAGVGRITIADGDQIDVSNLHRQPLFRAADVGHSKALVAAERLRSLNPLSKVRAIAQHVVAATASELVATHDVVLDCTDNFRAKFLLNDLCVRLGKSLVTASIDRFDAQLMVIDPVGPCLRCLWPIAPEDGCVGSCEENGVIGYAPGVVGALQAGEALKVILGLPSLESRVAVLDLRTLDVRTLGLERNPVCPACGTPRPVKVEADPLLVADILADDLIVDIREPYETAADPLNSVMRMPMSRFDLADPALLDAPRVVLVCAKGIRSLALARELRGRGWSHVYGYDGGAKELRAARG